MYFTGKELPGEILSVLRYWVEEYHVDGFHLTGFRIFLWQRKTRF